MRYPQQLFLKACADNNLLSHFLSLIRAGKEMKSYNGFVLMARRAKIYEGKAKILYEGPEPEQLFSILRMMQQHLMLKKKK